MVEGERDVAYQDGMGVESHPTWTVRKVELFIMQASQVPREVYGALKMTQDDLNNLEYTDGCAQCEHIMRYQVGRPGYCNLGACRQRIVDALMQAAVGRERFRRLEERVDRALGS